MIAHISSGVGVAAETADVHRPNTSPAANFFITAIPLNSKSPIGEGNSSRNDSHKQYEMRNILIQDEIIGNLASFQCVGLDVTPPVVRSDAQPCSSAA
jgi:hypothetical protein